MIRQIVKNDYRTFFRNLELERSEFRYPPFTRLIYIYLKHRDNATVETAGIELANRLRQSLGGRVLGPDRPAVARVKTLFIRKVMLKLELGLQPQAVRQYILNTVNLMMQDDRYKSLLVYYDVDPE